MIRMLGAVCLGGGPGLAGNERCGGAGPPGAGPGGPVRWTGADGAGAGPAADPAAPADGGAGSPDGGAARRLFSACRRALDGLERETFAHAWRRLTDQLPVSPEAKRALYPLGRCWGAMTAGTAGGHRRGPAGAGGTAGPGRGGASPAGKGVRSPGGDSGSLSGHPPFVKSGESAAGPEFRRKKPGQVGTVTEERKRGI